MLADQVAREVARWKPFDRWTVGVQLVRAADSVGANIAEGFGRGRGPDRRRMFLIARGSLHETRHWLRLAGSRELLKPAALDAIAVEVVKLLNDLIRAERA